MAAEELVIKVSALVSDVEKSFAGVRRSVDQLGTGFDGINSKVAAFGRTFGVALGTTAVVSGLQRLAATVLENAGNITDLSNKTGLAMRTIQQFQHVAEQTGTTVDAFTNAAFKLGTNLAGGSKSVVAGVTALGLSFKDLQALSPDEQFNRIASALGDMENPQERNRIALELFGKSAKDILPAIAEGYRKIAGEAVIASDEQIKSLDRAGDAFSKFFRDATQHATAAAGALVLAGQGIAEAGFTKLFTDSFSKGGPIAAGLDVVATKFADVELAGLKSAAGNQKVTKSLTDLIAETDRTAEAQKKAQRATEAYTQSVKALTDRLSGAALTSEVGKLSDAIKGLTTEQKKNPAVMDRMADAAQDLQQRGAALTPELFQLTLTTGRFFDELMRGQAGFDAIAQGFKTTDGGIQQTVDRLNEFIDLMNDPKLRGVVGGAIETGGFQFGTPAIPPPPEVKQRFDEVARAIQHLGQVAGGTFGEMVTGIGGLMEAMDTYRQHTLTNTQKIGAAIEGIAHVWAATGGNQTPGQGALSGALAGASAGAMFGPWGAAAGAVGGAILGAIRGTTEYEQRVRAAAESMRQLTNAAVEQAGGLDKLRAQFSVVGIQIDEALRSRNPEFLREVLNEGYEKTRILNDALVEYGLTWENLGATGRAVELGSQFDTLKAKTDVLKDAGVDYNLILEKQKGQYSELVQAAIRTGTEIPEAMKGTLQDLVNLGELVREDGTAFQDLGDISWSKTMTQGFADVTNAIDRLIEVFTGHGGLNNQLDNLSRRNIRIPIGFDLDRVPDLSRSSVSIGTLPTPEDGTTTVILEMDGRTLAEAVVPNIPGVVERYGLV